MFGLQTQKRLHDEKIVERWSTLIEGAQGRGEEVFRMTAQKIADSKIPSIKIGKHEVSPQKSGSGKLRPFLVVGHDRFHEYEMFIGFQDYGNYLSVYWYLAGEPTKMPRALGTWQSANSAIVQATGGQGSIVGLTAYLMNLSLGFTGKIFNRVKDVAKGHISSEDMDLFDSEELSAFITIGHHAVLDSVEDLMNGLNQDFSKVDRKTRGFLNIS